MPPGLSQCAASGIDEDDGGMGVGGGGSHVARVLLVARGIGDDESALGRRKITIGNVEGAAVFALGAQAVGNERKIDGAVRTVDPAVLNRDQLVLVDSFGVVQQAADQGGLAVIHAAGCGKPQKVGAGGWPGGIQGERFSNCSRHQKYPSRFLSSMEPSSSWSMTRFSRSDRRKPIISSIILGTASASEAMAPLQGTHPSERMRHLIFCARSPGRRC